MSEQQPSLSQAFLLASRGAVTTLPIEDTTAGGGCGCGSTDATKDQPAATDAPTTKSSCCG